MSTNTPVFKTLKNYFGTPKEYFLTYGISLEDAIVLKYWNVGESVKDVPKRVASVFNGDLTAWNILHYSSHDTMTAQGSGKKTIEQIEEYREKRQMFLLDDLTAMTPKQARDWLHRMGNDLDIRRPGWRKGTAVRPDIEKEKNTFRTPEEYFLTHNISPEKIALTRYFEIKNNDAAEKIFSALGNEKYTAYYLLTRDLDAIEEHYIKMKHIDPKNKFYSNRYDGIQDLKASPDRQKFIFGNDLENTSKEQFDNWLTGMETTLNHVDPDWRQKLVFPERMEFSVENTDPDEAERQHIKNFITDRFAKDMGRIGRPFKTLLADIYTADRLTKETFLAVDGKTNADGDVLDNIGDLVLNGREKLQDFGVTDDEITILNQGLHKAYRLNLDMRENHEMAYRKDIDERCEEAMRLHKDPVAMRRAKKAAYYNTYFTAP